MKSFEIKNMFHNKKGFMKSLSTRWIKNVKNCDFRPEELKKLKSIWVDEIHIGLQHPVEVNNTAYLTSATAGSSINRRD